jgi:hypothetical protein
MDTSTIAATVNHQLHQLHATPTIRLRSGMNKILEINIQDDLQKCRNSLSVHNLLTSAINQQLISAGRPLPGRLPEQLSVLLGTLAGLPAVPTETADRCDSIRFRSTAYALARASAGIGICVARRYTVIWTPDSPVPLQWLMEAAHTRSDLDGLLLESTEQGRCTISWLRYLLISVPHAGATVHSA